MDNGEIKIYPTTEDAITDALNKLTPGPEKSGSRF
jgi:hypothetical protein